MNLDNNLITFENCVEDDGRLILNEDEFELLRATIKNRITKKQLN